MGLNPPRADQMAKSCGGFKNLSQQQQKATIDAMNETGPGSLFLKARRTGKVTDPQMREKLGFDDPTRSREDVALHQSRAVLLNAGMVIRDLCVKEAESEHDRAETKYEKELHAARRATIPKHQKVRAKLTKLNKYCFCGKGTRDHDHLECGSDANGKRYCPFRGRVHHACSQGRGEPPEDPYFCFYCSAVPKSSSN